MKLNNRLRFLRVSYNFLLEKLLWLWELLASNFIKFLVKFLKSTNISIEFFQRNFQKIYNSISTHPKVKEFQRFITPLVKKYTRVVRVFLHKNRQILVPFATGVAIILIPLFILSVKNALKVEAAWWDDTWKYRKAVRVYYSGTTSLSDYQIKFTLDVAAINAKLNDDCSDIRVTDEKGDPVYFWIQDDDSASDTITCTTGTKTIWVRAPLIGAAANTTFYVYYGNTNASTASDGNNTFQFFDDFTAGALDTAKWTNSGGTVTFASGNMNVTTATDGIVYGAPNFLNGVIGGSLKLADTSAEQYTFFGFSLSGNTQRAMFTEQNAAHYVISHTTSTNQTSTSVTYAPTAYHRYEVSLKSGIQNDFYYDDALLATHTTVANIPSVAVGPMLRSNVSSASTPNIASDYIYVRAYSATFPVTGATGGEESTASPVAAYNFNEGIGSVTKNEQLKNFGANVVDNSVTDITVNAYVNPKGNSQWNNAAQTIVSKWGSSTSGFTNTSNWTAFDLSAQTISSLTGSGGWMVKGGAFDGKYMYFSGSYENTPGWTAKMLKYDTALPFTSASSWEAINLGSATIDGVSSILASWSNIFDGRYIYYLPYNDTKGKFLRYDTTKPFTFTSSWNAVDLVAATVDSVSTFKGYHGAAFDGRFIYFTPRDEGDNYNGKMLRYDTTGTFTSTTAWDAYDVRNLTIDGVSGMKKFYGNVFDGRYIYYVSGHDGSALNTKVLRFDTTGSFSSVSSWDALDLTSATVDGISSFVYNYPGVFDGRYVYFGNVSGSSGKLLRYDITLPFASTTSWDAVNLTSSTIDSVSGFLGYTIGSFDGRYVYYVPGHDGSVYQGKMLRYDTTLSFSDTASWDALDLTSATISSISNFKGYGSASYDGRYIYLTGEYNLTDAYHGKMLRYDTLGEGSSDNFGSYSLDYSGSTAYGGSASGGPTFKVATSGGIRTVSFNNTFNTTEPAQISGSYDGTKISLSVNGSVVSRTYSAAANALTTTTPVKVENTYLGNTNFSRSERLTNVVGNVNDNTDAVVTAGATGNNTTVSSMWNTQGVDGTSISMDGTDDYVQVNGPVNNIKSISLWVKPSTRADYVYFLDLGPANTYLRFSADGTVSYGAGITSPTIYVNGSTTNKVQVNRWNNIVLTTATAVNGSAITLGKYSTNYYSGLMDNVKFYEFVLTKAQRLKEYNFGIGKNQEVSSFEGSDGLLAYWKLDEATGTNAADSSGNGYTLTANNSPTMELGKFGNSVNIAHASGDTNNFSRAQASATNLNIGSGDFTISFWMKPGTLDSNMIPMSYGTSSGGWYVQATSTNNKLNFVVSNGSAVTMTTANNVISNGTWAHVVIVKKDTSGKIYIDGVNKTSGTPSLPATVTANSTNAFYLGRYGNTTYPYDGNLDEIKIYNRALDVTEVKDVYLKNGNSVMDLGFDERSGLTSYDRSGYGNNATLKISNVSTSEVLPWSGLGKYGNSLNFTGNSQYAVVNDSVSLDVPDNFSISAWVNPDSITSDMAVLDKKGAYRLSVGNGRASFGIGATTTLLDGIAGITDVFYYDTTKDTVATTWRTTAAKSWYGETIDATYAACNVATNDRCGTKEFPRRAIIVSTAAYVYIFDAENNGMWMRISSPNFKSYGSTKAVFMLNGVLYSAEDTGSTGLIRKLDFVSDTDMVISTGGLYKTTLVGVDNYTIAVRNVASDGNSLVSAGWGIASSRVSDVHAAVISGATYVAVATPTAISLIKTATPVTYDGTYASTTFSKVFLTSGGELYFDYIVASRSGVLIAKYAAQSIAADWSAGATYSTYYEASKANSSSLPLIGPAASDANEIKSIYVTENTSTIDGTSNTIYVGQDYGLSVIQENQATAASGSAKHINTAYTSEEMIGDNRAMLPMNYASLTASTTITSADVSYKANAFTTQAVATVPTVGSAGVRNTSLSFDGGDYICSGTTGTCGDDADLDVTTIATDNISVGAWVKKAANDALMGIVSKYSNLVANQAYRLNFNATNNVVFSVGNGTTLTSITATTPITDTNWHHVVGVFDNTNNLMYVYVDGVSAATAVANANAAVNSTMSVLIGADKSGAGDAITNYFTGNIDEVFINVGALTATQVANMYAVGRKSLAAAGTGTINGASNNVQAISAVPIKDSAILLGSPSMIQIGTDTGGVTLFDTSSDTQYTNYTASTTPAIKDENIKSITPINAFSFVAAVDDTNDGVSKIEDVSGNVDLPTGNWTHIQGTYDDVAQEMRLYQNQQLVSTTKLPSAFNMTANTNNITIAGVTEGSFAGSFFDGRIDEVKLFTFVPTQRNVSINTAPSRPINPSVYLKLDEGYGTTTKDSVTGTVSATITGALWSSTGKYGKSLSYVASGGIWYDTTFLYSKSFTLSGATLSEFVLTIDTLSLIGGTKMNSDCSDIRMVEYNSSTKIWAPLNFWIESGCNTVTTRIWVNNVTQSAVYMYYGNPAATSVELAWSGNFLLLGTDCSTTSGWTRNTAFDSNFPRIVASSPGGTGGSTTHTHASSSCLLGYTDTTNMTMYDYGSPTSTGMAMPLAAHTHSVTANVSTAAEVYPNYYSMYFCTGKKLNMSQIFVSPFLTASCPTSWSSYSNLNTSNRFPYGSSTVGTTYSSTHTHTAAGTIHVAGQVYNTRSQTPKREYYTMHAHNVGAAITLTLTTPGAILPSSYRNALYCYGSTVPSSDMASMFTVAVPPLGWSQNTSMNGVFLRGNTSVGVTTASTHTHTVTSPASGGISNISTFNYSNYTPFLQTGTNTDHTHTGCNQANGAADGTMLPPYVNVLYATQKNTSGLSYITSPEKEYSGLSPVIMYSKIPSSQGVTFKNGISAWFKGIIPTTASTLLTTIDSINSAVTSLLMVTSSGNICYSIDDDTMWDPDSVICSQGFYGDNNWHHVVAQRNGNYLELYVDGKKDADFVDASAVAVNTNVNSFLMGVGDEDSGGNGWTGNIDEVRLFEYPLSTSDILAEYNHVSSLNVGKNIQDARNVDGTGTVGVGPVAYYNFNENTGTSANDSSTNSLTNLVGTVTNAVWDSVGKFGSAIKFDGTGDYVSVADSSTLDFAAADNFTVSAWFKTSTDSKVILSKADTTTGGYKIYMSSGEVCFGVDDDATWGPDVSACTPVELGTDINYNDGAWHFVTATKTGTTSIVVYIDGVLAATTTAAIPSGTLANGNALYIGMDRDGSSNGFVGSIDDVRIYNYNRSQKQILQDMYGDTYTIRPSALWTFDEANGQTISSSHADKLKMNVSSLVGTFGTSASNTLNDPTWDATTTNCSKGYCLTFDGVNDYVAAPVGGSLMASSKSAITLEGRFKPTTTFDNTVDYNQGIMDTGDHQVFLDKSDGKLKVALSDNGASTFNYSMDNSTNAFSNINVMASYNGHLYAGITGTVDGESTIYVCTDANSNGLCDTGEWAASYNGSTGRIGVRSMAVFKGKLYAGFGYDSGDALVLVCSDGNSNGVCDTGEWTDALAGLSTTYRSVQSMNVFDGRLYIGLGGITVGDGDVRMCNPATAGAATICDNASDWSYSYNDAGTTYEEVASMATFEGKLYMGMGNGANDGDIFYCTDVDSDGCEMAEWTQSFSAVSNEKTIMALTVFNNRLYAGSMDVGFLSVCDDLGELGTGDLDGICDSGEWRAAGTNWPLNTYNAGGIFAMTVSRGNLYVASGAVNGGSTASNIVHSCNPATAGTSFLCDNASDWTTLLAGSSTYSGRSLINYNGRVYAGLSGSGTGPGDIYVYKPATIPATVIASTTSSWTAGTWYKYTMTYDGSTMKLYIDDILQSSVTSSMSLTTSSDKRILFGETYGSQINGGAGGAAPENFKGSLDEIGIFNYALDAADLREYQNGGALKYN